MGKVVHDALNREIGFILGGRQRAPDNRHDCDSLRISVQTAEYALGMSDRLAAATGGRSNRLVRKMRHVRSTFAKDFTIEGQRRRPPQDAVGARSLFLNLCGEGGCAPYAVVPLRD